VPVKGNVEKVPEFVAGDPGASVIKN